VNRIGVNFLKQLRKLGPADPFVLDVAVVQALAEVVNTPRAVTVALLIANEEWDQLATLAISPLHYLEQDKLRFRDDYMLTKALSKHQRMPTSFDRTQVALEAALEVDEHLGAFDFDKRLPESTSVAVHAVKLEVARVLRESKRKALRRLNIVCEHDSEAVCPCVISMTQTLAKHGNGSAVGFPKRLHSVYKNSCVSTSTPALSDVARSIKGQAWSRYSPRNKVVSSSRTLTVPKNCKTDRVICQEPLLNVYLQLGLGRLLRLMLKVLGIDLSTQELNQELARNAQDLGLATLDLKSASDSISTRIVYDVFPPDWFELFDLLRTSLTQYPDGRVVEPFRFCSMGNGFTFPLQTLLYLSVIRVVCGDLRKAPVAIYGDDIIIEQQHYDDVVAMLQSLGFQVNEAKSFRKGVFFESCGADFFDRLDVTPFYLGRSAEKDAVLYGIPYEYALANKIRLWSARASGYQTSDRRFKAVWTTLVDRLKDGVYFGPRLLGDCVLAASNLEADERHVTEPQDRLGLNGWDGVRIRCYKPYNAGEPIHDSSAYIQALRNLCERHETESFAQVVYEAASGALALWPSKSLERDLSLVAAPIYTERAVYRSGWTTALWSSELAWSSPLARQD